MKKIELLIGLSLSVSLTFMSVGCASSKSAKTEIESQKASTTNSDTANNSIASKAGTSNSVKNNTTTGNAGTKNTAQNNTTTGNTTSNNNTSKNTTSKNNSTSNSSTTAKNTTANNNTIVYTTQSAIIYKKIGGSAYHTLPRWEQVKKLGTSGNYTYIEWLDEKFYIETKYLTDTIPQSPNRSKWIYTWDKLKNQLSKNTFGDKLYQRDGFFAYNPFYPKWRQNVSTEFDLFHIYRPDPEVVTVDWDFALSIDHFSDDKDYGSTKDFDETTKAIFEMIFPGKGLEFDAKLSDILNGKGKTYCKDITIK